MNNTDKIVKLFQEALDNDPQLGELFFYRVVANQATQDHPVIQVTQSGEVGALGLINAILETLGEDKLAIVIDNGKVVGFANYAAL